MDQEIRRQEAWEESNRSQTREVAYLLQGGNTLLAAVGGSNVNLLENVWECVSCAER